MSEQYQDYLACTYFGKDAYDREEFVSLKDDLIGIDRCIDVDATFVPLSLRKWRERRENRRRFGRLKAPVPPLPPEGA